jgi:hypothetical protein
LAACATFERGQREGHSVPGSAGISARDACLKDTKRAHGISRAERPALPGTASKRGIRAAFTQSRVSGLFDGGWWKNASAPFAPCIPLAAQHQLITDVTQPADFAGPDLVSGRKLPVWSPRVRGLTQGQALRAAQHQLITLDD